jgi:nicotinamidase-related amidase
MKKKIDLLIIDPQRGFCDPTLNGGKGELFVTGADTSIRRLTQFVEKNSKWLRDIDVTLDSHHAFHIGHGLYWRDGKGHEPPPFTQITAADVEGGVWGVRAPHLREYTINYLKQLEARGRYKHTVWPNHCIIATEGYMVMPELMAALVGWERSQVAIVGKHSKGSCPYTEHFSGVQAEVPYPEDPATGLNVALVQKLQEADTLLIAGQALSHCVANTVRDVATAFGDPALVSKFVLLEDCTDSVPGFESLARDFVNEFKAKGMKVAKSTDVL